MRRSLVTLVLVALCTVASVVAPTLTAPPTPAPTGAAPPPDPVGPPRADVRVDLDGPISSAGGGRFMIVEVDTPKWGSAKDITVDVTFAEVVTDVRLACPATAQCSGREEGHLVVHSPRMDVARDDRRTFGLWVETAPTVTGPLELAEVTVRYTDERDRPMVWRSTVAVEAAPPLDAAARRRPDVARSAVMALAIDELYLSTWALDSDRTEARRHAEAARAWADALDDALPADGSIRWLQEATWAWRTELPHLVPAAATTRARIDELHAAIGAR